MDCSPPGSSVHGISQARILEWAAISFYRASSPPQGLNPSLPSKESLPLRHSGTPPPATRTSRIAGPQGQAQHPGRGPGPWSSLLALGRDLGFSCCPGSQPGHSRGSRAHAGKLRRRWEGSQVLRETSAPGTGVGNTSFRPHSPAGLRFRRQQPGL